MHAGAIKHLYQNARELRNNATHAEQILWNYLRNKPLGLKFRRQHPYSLYILDFYCHSLKIVIEVDGSIHEIEKVKESDKVRQKSLEDDGLKVIRFTNEEIIRYLEKVTERIENLITTLKNETK